MSELKSVPNVGFNSFGRFRISDPFDQTLLSSHASYNLLAVSNRFGLVFLATNSGLKVIDSKTFRSHRVTKENFKQEISQFDSRTVNVGASITHLRCNSDGSKLLIIILASDNECCALVYDVLCFHEKFTESVGPMCRVKLSSAVNCVEWNPGVADTLAICCLDGHVILLQINGVDKFTVEVSVNTSKPKAVCLSWSPKGKQLMIAFDDCSLGQFKPNQLQQPIKRVEPVTATILGFQPETVSAICWLSTTHVAAVYTAENQSECKVAFCHVTLCKEGPAVFKNLDDVCFGNAAIKRPHYYIIHISEWKLIICCSTNSIESAVLGWNSEAKNWQILSPDEELRAELPLSQSECETYPVGCALDLVATEESADPILLLYSSDGLLCPFKVTCAGHAEALCKPRQTPTSFNAQVSKNIVLPSSPGQFVSKPSGPTLTEIPEPKIPGLQRATERVEQSKASETHQNLDSASRAPSQILADKQLMSIRVEISKAIARFESDLRNLKQQCKQPMTLGKDRISALSEISRQTNDGLQRLTSLKQTYQDFLALSSQLYRNFVENRILAENCRALLERRNDVEQQSLWREKPLTPYQQRAIDDLSDRIKSIDLSIDDLIEKINQLLTDRYEKRDKPKENSFQLAYRTLSNMQSIILLQRQKICELKQRSYSSEAPKLGYSLQSADKASISTPTDSFTSLSVGGSLHSICIAPCDTPLTKFLQSRNFVPRRRTTPLAEDLKLSLSVASFLSEKKATVAQAPPPVESKVTQLSEKIPDVKWTTVAKPTISAAQGVKQPLTSKPAPPKTVPSKPSGGRAEGSKVVGAGPALLTTEPATPAPFKIADVVKPIELPVIDNRDVIGTSAMTSLISTFSVEPDAETGSNVPLTAESRPLFTPPPVSRPTGSGSAVEKPLILPTVAEPKSHLPNFGSSTTSNTHTALDASAAKFSKEISPPSTVSIGSLSTTTVTTPLTREDKISTTSDATVILAASPRKTPVTSFIESPKSNLGESKQKEPDVEVTVTLPLPASSNGNENVENTSNVTAEATVIAAADVISSQSDEKSKDDSNNGAMEADLVANSSTSIEGQTTPNFSFSLSKADTPLSGQSSVFQSPVGGGFFSGLGGAPKPESAGKNVFGFGAFGQPASTAAPSSGLFASPPTTTVIGNGPFGQSFFKGTAQTSSASGSFSAGLGSVAQQGFGSLGHKSPSGAFGSPATFGGSPTFGALATGGSSIFGGAPSFAGIGGGSPSAFGASPSISQTTSGIFGSATSGFATFAKTSSPSFGSLAGGSSAFGSQSIFGSGNVQNSSSSTPAAPSFSQWRG